MKGFFRDAHNRLQQLRSRHSAKFRLPVRLQTFLTNARNYLRNNARARYAAYGLLSVALLLVLFISFVLTQTPSKKELTSIRNAVASEVYSADSVLLGRYFVQDRTEIKYEDIAPHLIDALIATEDIRFYTHSGIDYRSLGRVLVKSILLQDESAGGGSTITQQLAKNLYPRKSYLFASMLVNKF